MMARWLQNGRMSSKPFQSADPMDSGDPADAEDPGFAEGISARAMLEKPSRMSRKLISRTVPGRFAHGSSGGGTPIRCTDMLCLAKTRAIPSTKSSALLWRGVREAESNLGTGQDSVDTVDCASNCPPLV